MKVEIKEVVAYKGHSVKVNGNLDLTFSAMYDQITKSMEILQMLNNNIMITAKLPGSKPVKLGMFNIKNISFDNDGESILKFNTLFDYVEYDNLKSIINQENFVIRLEADVELENDEEEEG